MKYVAEAIPDVDALRCELERQLERDNGTALFPALFDLQGRLVPACLVDTLHGPQWAILASDEPHSSKVIAWFSPSRAKSDGVRIRHDVTKGYYVGTVRTQAHIEEVGTGVHQRVALVRRKAFCRDVQVVDNGVEGRRETYLTERKRAQYGS